MVCCGEEKVGGVGGGEWELGLGCNIQKIFKNSGQPGLRVVLTEIIKRQRTLCEDKKWKGDHA